MWWSRSDRSREAEAAELSHSDGRSLSWHNEGMRFALITFLSLLGCPISASALTEHAEPVPPLVLPAALICVEAPGTSDARPCAPWCEDWAASHVLRFMRITPVDGEAQDKWQSLRCGDYLAERHAL